MNLDPYLAPCVKFNLKGLDLNIKATTIKHLKEIGKNFVALIIQESLNMTPKEQQKKGKK